MTQKILSQTESDELAAIIGEAEKSTSGEIRLMIVGRSTARPPVLALLWLALSVVLLALLWWQRHAVWLHTLPVLSDEPWWLVPIALALAALVAWPLSCLSTLERLMLAPAEVERAVWWRAELEFHREGLGETRGATGILLFLSLLERKAVVLADRAIASQLPPATWNEVVAIILQGGRTGQWRARLEEAIRLCAKHLSTLFPPAKGDVNELPNTVILKD